VRIGPEPSTGDRLSVAITGGDWISLVERGSSASEAVRSEQAAPNIRKHRPLTNGKGTSDANRTMQKCRRDILKRHTQYKAQPNSRLHGRDTISAIGRLPCN